MKFDYKYVVMKNEDIGRALSMEEIHQLDMIMEKIDKYRMSVGKKDNSYLVVNTDESYAPKVASILKEAGHYRNDPMENEQYIEVKEEA